MMRLIVLSAGLASVSGAGYEVWASDQSNSAAGQSALGVKGSFLWIFDSPDIETQIDTRTTAEPLKCYDSQQSGEACDILEVFPQNLEQYEQRNNGKIKRTMKSLGDLPGFGRLHGVIRDPQNKYVVANMFAPGGGYVGVIDVATKEAIALFRVTAFLTGRSVHMSFFDDFDGSSILIDNLNGKAIEKIDVVRDSSGKIIDLIFNKAKTLGLGKNMEVIEEATVFKGKNAKGNDLIGTIAGNYDFETKLNDYTPNNKCKEDGCGDDEHDDGGRPNNLPICPISSQNQNLYITLGGGGMFVVDIPTMNIVGEYSNNVIYGAGCGGIEVDGNNMFINSGISASPAGNTQSMFAIWKFDDNAFLTGGLGENTPLPDIVYEDPGNTKTGGNPSGEAENSSGQLPTNSTRRDSHGMDVTEDQRYLHVGDRIQNNMEVFDTDTYQRFTYDLTSANGKGSSGVGACAAVSVVGVVPNDPAPDLFERTPDGKYLMVSFRGPAPVSVPHSSQGSCPGVGVVELLANGKFGRLIEVLRTTNTVSDNVEVVSLPNGEGEPIDYTGPERSDIHGTIVVPK